MQILLGYKARLGRPRFKYKNKESSHSWSSAHAWKACIPQGIEGSNPSLSAIGFI